jgi:hypothetical protein
MSQYNVTPVLDRDVFIVERASDGRCVEVTPLDVMTHDGTPQELFEARFAADEAEHPVKRTMLVLKR